jgi:hypothetical protein
VWCEAPTRTSAGEVRALESTTATLPAAAASGPP